METSEKQIHWCFYIHPHFTSVYILDFCLVIWAKLTLPLWVLTMLIPRGLCCMLLWRWSMEPWPADIVTLLSWAVRRRNRVVVRLKTAHWNVRLRCSRMQCSHRQELTKIKKTYFWVRGRSLDFLCLWIYFFFWHNFMPMEILKHIKQKECLSVACFVCLTKLKHQWLNSEVCSHVSLPLTS